MVKTFREATDKPFGVDVNEGWKDAGEALQKIEWLATLGCRFVEQPLPVAAWKQMEEVKKRSPLPVIADESIQTVGDLDRVVSCFNGINIKLLKAGGISGALDLLKRGADLKLQRLIGCMSESSCAVAAAAQLADAAFIADLDGPFLIKNDPFTGLHLQDGHIQLSKEPGIGVVPKKDFIF